MPSPDNNFRNGGGSGGLGSHSQANEREGVACPPDAEVLPLYNPVYRQPLQMQLPVQSVICFGAGVGITLLIMHLCRNSR